MKLIYYSVLMVVVPISVFFVLHDFLLAGECMIAPPIHVGRQSIKSSIVHAHARRNHWMGSRAH